MLAVFVILIGAERLAATAVRGDLLCGITFVQQRHLHEVCIRCALFMRKEGKGIRIILQRQLHGGKDHGKRQAKPRRREKKNHEEDPPDDVLTMRLFHFTTSPFP